LKNFLAASTASGIIFEGALPGGVIPEHALNAGVHFALVHDLQLDDPAPVIH
jgi:hypothetical protein